MLEIDLTNVEEILGVRTNLRYVEIPSPEFIKKTYEYLYPSLVKPYMPVRDLSIFDTTIYIAKKYMILSGGYGINACFFQPDERRLSLADIDFISTENVEDLIEKINNNIIKNSGAILLRLGNQEVVLGTITLNIKKMQWLRRIGAENIYSFKRTILLPKIGHYMLRGEYLPNYLERYGFSNEKEWAKFKREARKHGVDGFRVETIEIDIAIMDTPHIQRTITPTLEITGIEKYAKEKPTVRVIEPNNAVDYLKNALEYFYSKKQTHNTVKTLLDLRLSKLLGREKEISKTAMEIATKKEFRQEYESGKESWRFAILRKKYQRLIDIARKWFQNK